MRANHFDLHALCVRRGVLVLAALLLSACVTTSPSRSPTHVAIQDEVGFTITEVAHMSGNTRNDYADALMLLEQGDLDAGISRLMSVVESAPQLSAPRIDLGIAQGRAGTLEAAEKSLLAALALSPDHPIAHNELGIVYRKAGRFAEARHSYLSALAVYPGYHYARRNLAVLCDLYLADPGCALENYEAYMATVPSDDEAAMWIADLRMRMGQTQE